MASAKHEYLCQGVTCVAAVTQYWLIRVVIGPALAATDLLATGGLKLDSRTTSLDASVPPALVLALSLLTFLPTFALRHRVVFILSVIATFVVWSGYGFLNALFGHKASHPFESELAVWMAFPITSISILSLAYLAPKLLLREKSI